MRLVHLVLLVGCASLLFAQARKHAEPEASPSRLISINESGSKRYTPAQIVAATGLRPGQTVNEDDFKLVSQRLGETGAFSNVAYSFQFSPAGIKLELQVTDSDPFVPVRFENFVWLSDQDLQDKLQAAVPLFQGQLPVSGTLVDQVSDALQGLAIEHHVQGRADYLRTGPQDGPVDGFDFSITGQPIHIRRVEFPGAGPAELPELEHLARQFSGQDYQRTALRREAEKDFLPVYFQRGCLKATLSGPEPKVVEDNAEETVVDVAFPVTPGPAYKLSELRLSGYKIFPYEQLRALIHLQPGQPANAVQVAKDVEGIKNLYGTRGYMAARIQPTPEMNDADSTVKYVLMFNEGDVYKMGDLDIRGLDSKDTERMAAAWKLREGDTYDSSYPQRFVNSAPGMLGGELWDIVVHQSVEDKDKTVDVSVHFEVKR
ncbi:MAG TPA: POTRA domain-containing protein [Terriglobales bacterium]|nr:POTRA domain-containing protein [Terriglobales bacterium]